MNYELLVTLILGLVDRAATLSALLSKAKTEGRDITPAELDAAFAEERAAHADLQRVIDAAKANSAPRI